MIKSTKYTPFPLVESKEEPSTLTFTHFDYNLALEECLNFWTEPEKKFLFDALSRLGPNQLTALSESVPTKTRAETLTLVKILKLCANALPEDLQEDFDTPSKRMKTRNSHLREERAEAKKLLKKEDIKSMKAIRDYQPSNELLDKMALFDVAQMQTKSSKYIHWECFEQLHDTLKQRLSKIIEAATLIARSLGSEEINEQIIAQAINFLRLEPERYCDFVMGLKNNEMEIEEDQGQQGQTDENSDDSNSQIYFLTDSDDGAEVLELSSSDPEPDTE